jgi:hypothetical protein
VTRRRPTGHDSPLNPDSPAGFLESPRGHVCIACLHLWKTSTNSEEVSEPARKREALRPIHAGFMRGSPTKLAYHALRRPGLLKPRRLGSHGPANVAGFVGTMLRCHGRGPYGRLITGVAQGRALPDEVTNQILVRTDGVPLFIEELTKAVLESGLLRKREHDYVLDGPLTPVAIPTTLHASLMARLDRLVSVRQVAQVGAALGRQFSYELLHAAAGIPERQLSDALEQLVNAELLYRRGVPPNAQYIFKHALVQDVAYASLLRANRQQVHARIARAYETRFPEVVRAQPELVAHHFTEAGLSDAAIEYWQRAGDLAMARSGHAEAIQRVGASVCRMIQFGLNCAVRIEADHAGKLGDHSSSRSSTYPWLSTTFPSRVIGA